MNTHPDRRIMELIAREMAIDEAFIEKDWYAVQVIAAIATFNYPDYQFVFSGGTALSKAHKLIQRFSEDIDFRLHTIGHKPNRSALSALKKQVISSLQKAGFTIDESSIKARNGNQFFAFMIRYERLFFHSGLRPDIKVEIKLDEPKLSTLIQPVSSFVAEFTKQAPEVSSIHCLAYVENAADKLSALTWRIAERKRGGENDDPTIIRHLHDLAILSSKIIHDPDFERLSIAAMEADANRARIDVFAGLSIAGRLEHLLNILNTDKAYAGEYQQFVAGLSYAKNDETPDYTSAIIMLQDLVEYFK